MSTVIDSLVSAINNAVKANGTKAITGNILQVVLDNMVGTLTQINGLLNVNQVNSKSDAYGSASAARQAVPDNLKTEGLVIAYKLSSGWVIEQNKNISGTWTADTSWQTVGPVGFSQNATTGNDTINIGDTNVVVADGNKLIKLAGFAYSQSAFEVGDIYYNITAQELRQKKDENNYDIIPFYDGAIYTFNKKLYLWSGVELICVSDFININKMLGRSSAFSSKADVYSNLPATTIVVGTVISYLLADGWHTEQCVDSSEAKQLTGWVEFPTRKEINVLDAVFESRNLIKDSELINGYIGTDGSIVSSNSYKTSTFIRLRSGDKVTISPNCQRLAEYNLNQQYITNTYKANLGDNYTYTQINDGYLRVTFVASYGNFQVERGSTATPYEPYHLRLNGVYLGEDALKDVEKVVRENVSVAIGYSNVESVNIDILPGIKWGVGWYKSDGSYDSNSSFKNTGKIETKRGDIFRFTSDTNIRIGVAFRNGAFVNVLGEYGKAFLVTEETDYVIFSCASTANVTELIKETAKPINNATEATFTTNYLDSSATIPDKLMRLDGTIVSGDVGSLVTDYIPVKAGERIVVGDGFNISRYFRFVTAFDDIKRVIAASGQEMAYGYTVPNGVSFIRCSLSASQVNDDTRINKSNNVLIYEPFKLEQLPKGTMDRRMLEYNLKNRPITTLGLTKSLQYRPLGQLSKAYFCLITDDGYEGVCTYSIPEIVIAKGVPMTFGIMKGSPCLESAYIDTLKDAINNHGCTVAQHGFTRFTEFTEDQLNSFFDAEKTYFDSIGLEMKGAICPGHNINSMVAAVCGQRFGVLRTGYHAGGSIKGLMPEQYDWYMNGEKSNVYALDCYGIATAPLQDHFGHIDYAKANNMLIIGFYHEWELDNQGGQLPHTQVEAVVDYAIQQGLEFVTLDQIPDLI